MRSRTSAAIVVSLLALAVSACSIGANSSSHIKPDWVSGASKNYPASSYITGIGSERYQKHAKTAAVNAILKSFTYVRDTGLPAYLGSDNMQRKAKPLQEALTNKIQIVDTWYDDGDRRYHAFAIVTKQYVGEQILELISSLDNTTRHHIERAGVTPDKLQKIVHAGKALQAQVVRSFYTDIMKNIDPGNSRARLIWQVARLREDFEKLLGRIRVKPLITNDDLGVLRPSLIGSLQAGNFGIAQAGQADYLLESSLVVNDRKKSGGKTQVQAELSINLLGTDRQSHGKQTWPVAFIDGPGEPGIGACRELLDRELLPAILDFAVQDK